MISFVFLHGKNKHTVKQKFDHKKDHDNKLKGKVESSDTWERVVTNNTSACLIEEGF